MELGVNLETMALRQAGATTSETKSFDCPACRDSGWVWNEHGRYVTPCACEERKKQMRRLEASGLSEAIKTQTFESYAVKETWQRKSLYTVRKWTQDVLEGGKGWLFCGGAVGSGKTHLCTAACGELLDAGFGVRYMLWTEKARQLKACVTDEDAFDELIYPLQQARVLYIDDLFKVDRGAKVGDIRTADIKVAFELLDARYRANRPTIISTEWLLEELLQLDEGTFSRVYQRSKGYKVQIARQDGRNWRLMEEE